MESCCDVTGRNFKSDSLYVARSVYRCLGAWKEYLSEIVAGNAIVCAHEKFCYFYLNIRRRFHRERGTWNFKLERVRLRLTT